MSSIIVSSLIFAIWSVILFFDKSIGISGFLFVAPFTYYLIFLLDKKSKIKNSKAKLFLIPIDLLALSYFIYDNSLKSLNVIAIQILLIAMLLMLFNDSFTFSKFIEKFIDLYIVPFAEFINNTKTTIKEFGLYFNKNKEKKDNGFIKKYGKAICCTLIISIVVIALLSSADSGFGELFEFFYDIILSVIEKLEVMDFIYKIILIFVIFIYLIGMMKIVLDHKEKDLQTNQNNSLVKDSLTLKMILGSLNFIYLLFFIIQIKEFMDFKNNLNYAEFARKGFFELIAVSVINFVTLIIAKNSEKKEDNKFYFKSMELIMIFFTFILLISAGIRMHLYESTYGYTHLRFMVYFSLLTEIIILIPTIMYILDKKMDLIKTSFIIATVMYVVLNYINMDSFIARKNIDRYIETGKIDFEYLQYNTGSDAIPEIVRLLDVKDKEVKKLVRGYIKKTSNELNENDSSIWEFNLSKYRAKKCLEENYK